MARLTCSFISYSLARTVEITIIIPSLTCPEVNMANPCHIPKAKYPVLYLLHGGWNDYSAWTSYTNIELFAEEHNIAVALFRVRIEPLRTIPAKVSPKRITALS